MENGEIRINKFLSEAGVCSRREADRKIENGEVIINDRVAVNGDKVSAKDSVYVNGRLIQKEEEMILLVMNKPKGIVCTAEKREKDNVIDFLNYPKRVYPIGRLDKDSEGLLLLTNNGDLVNKIMRAGNMHEKEYIVTVNKPVTDSFIRRRNDRRDYRAGYVFSANAIKCENAEYLTCVLVRSLLRFG